MVEPSVRVVGMVACPDHVRAEPSADRGRLDQDDPDAEAGQFPP
jgi:hypothetical protein